MSASHTGRVLESVSPARRRVVLLLALAVFVGAVVTLALVVVKASRDRVAPVAQNDPRSDKPGHAL